MKHSNILNKVCLLFVLAVLAMPTASHAKPHSVTDTSKPRIVNIINFIRLLEPRDAAITEDVLYQTVVKQVKLMNKHRLGGTFLLQYDALMDERYQKLLKSLPADQFEIGAWWELPQPIVEKAGLKWRGRYPWDWHADVGFSTGYVPEEREKLIDVYMEDFKKIFGYYPKSVASWFIDEHSLQYMYDKYKIVASANCKDQYGTDGYTLWGGYWNQAYYPSKLNSFMPAQNEANQIPVPVFRMLGSDPVRQYDFGLGSKRQGVVTLEPVYADGGGSQEWINWYFREFVEGASMAFAYVQAGQENSFTWNAMGKGLEIQFDLIEKLRDAKKLKVETLAASGEWFKQNFKVTPPTSVTVNKDLDSSDKKTVWFNSRFYRANLLWDAGTLRFRDIHMFDERLPSAYLKEKVTSNECNFFTLPVVDGYLWSKTVDSMAGIWFKTADGKKLLGSDPVVTDKANGMLHIEWPLKNSAGKLLMQLDEKKLRIEYKGTQKLDWQLVLNAAKEDQIPFTKFNKQSVEGLFQGIAYSIDVEKGKLLPVKGSKGFMVAPDKGVIVLDLANQ